MATVQEQAIEWLQHSRLRASLKEAAIALIPTLPLTWVGIPSCPACERVLCGVCGHCHGLDLLRSHPACPDDNSDMGHDCVAWYQALKAVMTVQRVSEESEPIIPLRDKWLESRVAERQERSKRATQFLREYTKEGKVFHVTYNTLKHHYFSWCKTSGPPDTEYSFSEILHVLNERSLVHYEPSTPEKRQSPATVIGMRMKHPVGLPRYYGDRKHLSNTVKEAVYAKLRSNGNVCALCAQPILADDKTHIDHILPVRKGGTDDPSNLQVVHDRCNLTKG